MILITIFLIRNQRGVHRRQRFKRLLHVACIGWPNRYSCRCYQRCNGLHFLGLSWSISNYYSLNRLCYELCVRRARTFIMIHWLLHVHYGRFLGVFFTFESLILPEANFIPSCTCIVCIFIHRFGWAIYIIDDDWDSNLAQSAGL